MTTPKRHIRLILGYLLRLGLGLGLLGLALWTNREQIGLVFDRRPNLWLFALGFGLYFTGAILAFVRWFFLTRAIGLPVTFGTTIWLGFVGNLYNMVVPGAVGGDFVKGAYLVRMLKTQKTQAAASVAIDRMIGLLGMFLLALVVGAFSWSGVEPPVRRLIGAAAFMTVAVTGVLAVAFAPPLYRPLAARLGGRPRIANTLNELAIMGSAYRRKLHVVVATVVMSSLTHVLNVVAFFVLGKAMFPDVPGLAQHFLIVPLVLFSTAIPLPFGALGVSEQISDVLFKLADYDGGALTMMAFHVVQYIGSLISLIVYLAHARQIRAATHDVKPIPGEGAPGFGQFDAL